MEERIFRNDAKQIVDLLFDTKLFKEDVTRDTMQGFEELILFMLQSRFESYKKVEKLFEKNKLITHPLS